MFFFITNIAVPVTTTIAPRKLSQVIFSEDMKLGCEPDFNVYTMQFNRIEDPYNIRTAGGHIHIGNTMISDGNVKDIHQLETLLMNFSKKTFTIYIYMEER